MTSQLSLMDLYQAGAHRGGKKSSINPSIRSRVHSFRSGIAVVDLAQTNTQLKAATEVMAKVGASRKPILIVGTSPHINEYVVEISKKFASGPQPYVDHRWLGGTLTNWMTIKKTLKTLDKLRNIIQDGEFFDKLARNEQLRLKRQETKISRTFGGLTTLKSNRPGAVFVLDADVNQNAIKEADIMNVPVVAFGSTAIPHLPKDPKKTVIFNTYSINAVELLTNALLEAYNTSYNEAVTKMQKNNQEQADNKGAQSKTKINA